MSNFGVRQSGTTVSVIDLLTDQVTQSISVGQAPMGVTASPDGTNVYVTNFAESSVALIDTSTDSVTATVAVGGGPIDVAFLQDGTAYVGSKPMAVIENGSTSATLFDDIRIDFFAVTPDGGTIYDASDPDIVEVIDVGTSDVLTTLTVGTTPRQVAIIEVSGQ